MFDDPRKNLQWLEEELLAEEEEESEEALDEEFDDLMDRADDLLDVDEVSPHTRGFAFSRPKKNPAVDFSRMVYDDEVFDEDAAVLAEDPPRRRGRKTEAAPKKKGINGLVFLAFLEVLGILAIIGWWLRWLI